MGLPEDLVDPEIDPNYVGFGLEIPYKGDEVDGQDTKADHNDDEGDDDHDVDDHDKHDDDDEKSANSIQ